MSEMTQEDPFENIGCELISELDQFDQTRHNFYDWLAELAVTLPDTSTYRQAASEFLDETAVAFTDMAISIHSSSDDVDAAKSGITELWLQDDNERVNMFRLLTTQDDTFESLGPDRTEEVVNDLYSNSGSEEELAENVFLVYRAFFGSDVQRFSDCLQEKRGMSLSPVLEENEPMIDISIDIATARKAILDVAKIAIGVSLGLMVTRRINRGK